MPLKYNDSLGRPRIAVTGVGVLTSLGCGLEDNWAALCNGVSGISEVTRFRTDYLKTRIAGTVDFLRLPAENAVERSYAFAKETAIEALGQAGLEGDFTGPLFLASPPIEPEWPARFALADQSDIDVEFANAYDRLLSVVRKHPDHKFHESVQFGTISERLANRFGTRGLPVTLSTACASGVTAIQMGVEAIRQGRTDRALCVATDGSVSAEALVRFSLLSALSTQNEHPDQASKPFSQDRDGFVMAEGAATLVLESLKSASARGARILGFVSGCAERTDPFHRTRSSPDGLPAIQTVQAALADAGLQPSDVDYVNAHGTSTPENDKMEFNAMAAVFGDRLPAIPCSSNKSMIGHTISAAGAIEAIFSLQSIRDGVVPPTINYNTPDPAIPLDVVANRRRDAVLTHVVSNSFGFGGQNASLVLSAAL
ncbi:MULTISPECIES: beta-ketoacyl-ACP synthase [Rhizobium]|jgi:3-oxoacyl-[acyl-carrier-protein] synthase II|uniref:beta-ketoacyl-ACP synthase n=1 Tax=Rhizobium TaxID=379 RepID=UPI00157238F9|nr:beta-ketoacyl-ACP synthase [Rhizobium rhizogenes]NTF98264.1 beta-ketoacyl-ACP synthase [Rhizobium rhizogenes]